VGSKGRTLPRQVARIHGQEQIAATGTAQIPQGGREMGIRTEELDRQRTLPLLRPAGEKPQPLHHRLRDDRQDREHSLSAGTVQEQSGTHERKYGGELHLPEESAVPFRPM